MKNSYERPKMQVISFMAEDIIATSNVNVESYDKTIGDDWGVRG